jgi:hypothetical protein
MKNRFTHSWHYHLVRIENSFSLYFNDRLIAIITKPATGQWPVHASINDKLFYFSKKNPLQKSIEITDAATGIKQGVIKRHFFSPLYSRTSIHFTSGEHYTLYSNNFFSLHWKWKKGDETLVNAVDKLAIKKNHGVIAINEYKAGTDLLIVAGFFLSLMRKSKLSLRIKGMKRRGEPALKQN